MRERVRDGPKERGRCYEGHVLAPNNLPQAVHLPRGTLRTFPFLRGSRCAVAPAWPSGGGMSTSTGRFEEGTRGLDLDSPGGQAPRMARLFKSITLQNFLSFGPEPSRIDLQPINLLVGANATGKSNLLEAFALLREAPRDFSAVIRESGTTVRDWLWQGDQASNPAASLVVSCEAGLVAPRSVEYGLTFTAHGPAFQVLDEWLQDEGESRAYYGVGASTTAVLRSADGTRREVPWSQLNHSQSIMAQRHDPDAYPELARLADLWGKVRIYRNWSQGPRSPLRAACRSNEPAGTLSEALDNLPIRLAVLKKRPEVKAKLVQHLRELAPGFDDFEVTPEGGLLQLYLVEGRRLFPAGRLSDGTLRYLALLAILLDPDPPPLLLLEEPELALHPDLLPTLRDLMQDAAERTQIIAPTHSPTFLDAWTENPEVVLICERDETGTHVNRLPPAQGPRTEGLGWRWMSGALGGTRW